MFSCNFFVNLTVRNHTYLETCDCYCKNTTKIATKSTLTPCLLIVVVLYKRIIVMT